MSDFAAWLSGELKKRGWSQRELARRAGLPQASVSKSLGGERNPTADICVKISAALGESPEHLLRLAGILPPTPDVDSDLTELLDLARRLPTNKLEELIRFARFLRQ